MRKISAAVLCLILLICCTNKNKLSDKIETVELHYTTWACECANWATKEDIIKYEGGSLAAHSVFIEPADASLTLPDTLRYNGNIVQFTGKYYVEKGYANDFVQSEQQVDKAKVFRYNSYKVIKSNYSENTSDEIDSARYKIDKGALIGKEKTLNVSYAAIMCSCPQWFETKFENDTTKNVEYFYLEPSNSTITKADTLFNGEFFPVRISVTGRYYEKKGYPKDFFPAKETPDSASVFRYHKIAVLQRGQRK